MAFKTAEAAMATAQPGDKVIKSGDHFVVESPALPRGGLVSSVYVAPVSRESGKTVASTRSVVPKDMGQPMTPGERATEDVLEARESGRRPSLGKLTIAFLHRRGIIK